MAKKTTGKKRPSSPDWFVQGVLTKIGDTFDRLTGRGWRPPSSLATSELAERLKALVDSEVKETPDKGRFVPHNIQLKMQWDKFATDDDGSLRKLETELLTALIDHINDRHYHTYAPLSLSVRPDYFTTGIKLFVSFDKIRENEGEVSVDVTVPSIKIEVHQEAERPASLARSMVLTLSFMLNAKPHGRVIQIAPGERLSVGRTKENDIVIDDPSISKIHATLFLNSEGKMMVADTGSTNGTFVDEERITYGKAITFSASQKLRFGAVQISMDAVEQEARIEPKAVEKERLDDGNVTQIGEFEFTNRMANQGPVNGTAAPTLPSFQEPDLKDLKQLSDIPVPGDSSDIPPEILPENEKDK